MVRTWQAKLVCKAIVCMLSLPRVSMGTHFAIPEVELGLTHIWKSPPDVMVKVSL